MEKLILENQIVIMETLICMAKTKIDIIKILDQIEKSKAAIKYYV